MIGKRKYQYLEKRPEKKSKELCVKETGVRASTIWHDRYVSRLAPAQIAKDRDISLEAVHEALMYCQEHWEQICREKDLEQRRLERKGFFEEGHADHP